MRTPDGVDRSPLVHGGGSDTGWGASGAQPERGRGLPSPRPGEVGAATCGAASAGASGADCAVGSGEWAEPPQYLPAMCWVGLKRRTARTECPYR